MPSHAYFHMQTLSLEAQSTGTHMLRQNNRCRIRSGGGATTANTSSGVSCALALLVGTSAAHYRCVAYWTPS